jgi:hypothetical protein
LTDRWIPVDPLQYGIERFLKSEKIDQERLFNPLVEKEISFLPEGENPIRGMNDVGIEHFGKSKKLPAF